MKDDSISQWVLVAAAAKENQQYSNSKTILQNLCQGCVPYLPASNNKSVGKCVMAQFFCIIVKVFPMVSLFSQKSNGVATLF